MSEASFISSYQGKCPKLKSSFYAFFNQINRLLALFTLGHSSRFPKWCLENIINKFLLINETTRHIGVTRSPKHSSFCRQLYVWNGLVLIAAQDLSWRNDHNNN